MNRVVAGPKGPLGKSREAAICLVFYIMQCLCCVILCYYTAPLGIFACTFHTEFAESSVRSRQGDPESCHRLEVS